MEGAKIPARTILSNHCPWNYRCSVGCQYIGLPIETVEGKDLTENFANNESEIDNFGNNTALVNNNLGKVDPERYPGMIKSIPEWSPFGHSYVAAIGFEEGSSDDIKKYQMGDLVKIENNTSLNPYMNTPQVFVCTSTHSNPRLFHPYFSKDHWLKDECSKELDSCKKRFPPRGENEKYQAYTRVKGHIPQPLRFGGFPGTEEYPFE